MVSPDSTAVPVPAGIWAVPRRIETSPMASRKRPAWAAAVPGRSRRRRSAVARTRMSVPSELVAQPDADDISIELVQGNVRAVLRSQEVSAQRHLLGQAVGDAGIEAVVLVVARGQEQGIGILEAAA